MKIALLALALPLAGCGMVDVVSKVSSSSSSSTSVGGGPTTKGTGKTVVETRKAEAATSVEFSGALKVEIARGAPSLTVEAQKAILPHLRSEFKGGHLRVWVEGSITTDEVMRVRYTTPNLTAVSASGATTVDAGAFSGGSVEIKLDGASTLAAKGSADALDLTLSGASTAKLADLAVRRATIKLDGASTADLHITDALTGTASGACTVNYSGSPKVSVQATGASSLNAKG